MLLFLAVVILLKTLAGVSSLFNVLRNTEWYMERWVAGVVQHPSHHIPSLSEALPHGVSSSSSSSSITGPTVCAKCKPILSRYEDAFKSLMHLGFKLKKRKNANPHPKKPLTIHYRYLKT